MLFSYHPFELDATAIINNALAGKACSNLLLDVQKNHLAGFQENSLFFSNRQIGFLDNQIYTDGVFFTR